MRARLVEEFPHRLSQTPKVAVGACKEEANERQSRNIKEMTSERVRGIKARSFGCGSVAYRTDAEFMVLWRAPLLEGGVGRPLQRQPRRARRS
jgi:hypothetical protein